MPDLKQTFIQKSIAAYLQDVIATIKVAAKRAGVGVTDEAVNSLAYETLQQGSGAVGNLTFDEALRFVDMGVGRGHPLGGLKAMSSVLEGKKAKGKQAIKGRKPKKIYTRIVYGKLTYLQNKLLYGYTQETIDTLKEELKN